MTTPEQIAARLSEAEREAMRLFSRDDELLLAENLSEEMLVRRMMEKGLVAYIGAAGHVFMQLTEFGLAVRAVILKEQKND